MREGFVLVLRLVWRVLAVHPVFRRESYLRRPIGRQKDSLQHASLQCKHDQPCSIHLCAVFELVRVVVLALEILLGTGIWPTLYLSCIPYLMAVYL